MRSAQLSWIGRKKYWGKCSKFQCERLLSKSIFKFLESQISTIQNMDSHLKSLQSSMTTIFIRGSYFSYCFFFSFYDLGKIWDDFCLLLQIYFQFTHSPFNLLFRRGQGCESNQYWIFEWIALCCTIWCCIESISCNKSSSTRLGQHILAT